MKSFVRQLNNKDGSAIVIAIFILLLVTMLGISATNTTAIELQIAGNDKLHKIAFYEADAGIQYAIAMIKKDIAKGMALSAIDPSTYTVPAGFSFTLSAISGTGPYSFTSASSSPENAQAIIEATFKRDSALDYGVFGNLKAKIKTSASIYSYDHDITPNPTPGDSTGQADIGSNGHIEIKSYAFIDGDAALGDDGADTKATIELKPEVTITGDAGVNVDRVEPDPLGVVGGEYAAKFTTYSTSNDNTLASPAISGTTIDIDVGETITLNGKPDGANYYLTKINLQNSSTLNIDASAGPVNIFLTGKLETNIESTIDIAGTPSDFSIFSNSTDNIEFKHGNLFKGLIYAPYARIEIENSANVYGAIWGNDVAIKASASIYFDTALKDKVPGDIKLVAWKDLQN